MNILALDPSLSSTGYAIINSDTKEIIRKGRFVTTNKDDTDSRIQKIICFLEQFDILVNAIILEDGFIGKGVKSSMDICQLRGALIAFYKYRGYAVKHQAPTLIRKNFGLKGNAKKEEVAQEVLKYYPNLESEIGVYSDKTNKNKTSDIYDAIATGLSYILNIKEEQC